MDESDEDLLARCQTGSIRAFETLLHRYQPRVQRFLERQIGSLEDAKDITQRTFLQVHSSLSRFQAGSRFSPWLFTIARRQGIDFLRQAGSRRRVHEQLVKEPGLDGGADPHELLTQQEEVEAIWQWIREHLDERSTEILWLRIQEDLDLWGIAKVTNLSQSNVKVLLHRARKSLLKNFSVDGPGSSKNSSGTFASVAFQRLI
ncbi:MAG: sigma-70 family RNA polymerase sigma factor [Akkermansiaceae bacterium]|jgi:RNA polymerase sigma-70 factor (ECF subfamily)